MAARPGARVVARTLADSPLPLARLAITRTLADSHHSSRSVAITRTLADSHHSSRSVAIARTLAALTALSPLSLPGLAPPPLVSPARAPTRERRATVIRSDQTL